VTPYLVVIAGAYRSGSTWMFNAVRLLMEESGRSVGWSGWPWVGDPMESFDVAIVKEHRYRADLAARADLILTSERDWDDVAESWRRFEGKRPGAGQLAVWRLNLDQWRAECAHRYCMDYATLADDPEEAFRIIWSWTAANVADGWRAWGRLLQIRPPTDRCYDPVTMMFSNHITQCESASV